MKLNTHRNAFLELMLAAWITLFARPSSAQLPTLHPSFYGSAEVDTRHTQFYLLGMYVGMGGLGWSPYFNINGWGLNFRPNQNLAATRTMSAVSPTLGLAYSGRNSGISFGAGYTWVHNPTPGTPGADGGSS